MVQKSIRSTTSAALPLLISFKCSIITCKKASGISLESEELIVVQPLLLLCLHQAPVPQPPLPLLRVEGEQDHQGGLKQVTGPAVQLRTLVREVAHWAAHGCGYGVRRRAVPEPGGRGARC